MGAADQKRSLDEAFERIEETILPSISLMLAAALVLLGNVVIWTAPVN